MLKNVLKTRLVAMLEATAANLATGADAGRIARSKGLLHYYKGLAKDREGNVVIRWKVPSQTKENLLYDCYVAIVPKNGVSLFSLAKSRKNLKYRMSVIKDADIKCFCSCPDFNWSGARYNNNVRGTLEHGFESIPGVPDGSSIKPVVRDPHGKMLVCKHLLAAFNGMKTNAATIMKDAAHARFSPKEGLEDKAESVTKDFFVTEKHEHGTQEPKQVNVADELLSETPVKIDAAEDALESLAISMPDEPNTPEPKTQEAAPAAEPETTVEPPKDNVDDAVSELGISDTPAEQPATQPPAQETAEDNTPASDEDLFMDFLNMF